MPRRRESIGALAGCQASCRRCRVGGHGQIRSLMFGRDVQKLFEDNAGLEAKTVFEYLQRQNPVVFRTGRCGRCSGR